MRCGTQHVNPRSALYLQLKYLRGIEEQERADREAVMESVGGKTTARALRGKSKQRRGVAALVARKDVGMSSMGLPAAPPLLDEDEALLGTDE